MARLLRAQKTLEPPPKGEFYAIRDQALDRISTEEGWAVKP